MQSNDWIIRTEGEGGAREFSPSALPLALGGSSSDDVRLRGVADTAQIGLLDGVFFLQPGRDARNVRIDGAPVRGTQRLADGALIALDRARLRCHLADGKLRLVIEELAVGGDTAPPDLEQVARDARAGDDLEIVPVAFKLPTSAGASPAAARSRAAAIATASAFVALALFGWFAFTAKSVQLTVTPAPDTLSLPGTLFKLKVGDRFLLRGGNHHVTARLAGYYPFETDIDVGEEGDQSFAFSLTKLPGIVSFSSAPSAMLSIDGTERGMTPLNDLELTPGAHQLELTAARYQMLTSEIDVVGGGEPQSFALTLEPDWASVSLATEPPGAEVLVDGTLTGATPIALDLLSGERQLEVRLRGYNAWRDTIAVTANEPQALPPIKLTPADGRVELASVPSEAAVSVDGEFKGRTPLTLKLAPRRTHVITLAKPGYDSATRELSVDADSGRRVEVQLTAQLGVVDVSSDPDQSEVWIDGEQRASTPAHVTLTAVEHTIEVRRAGFATERETLTPRPGFPQVLDFKLTALDAVSGSGYPALIKTSLGQQLKLVAVDEDARDEFTMGSSRRELGRRSNELLRPVKLTQAFYLGVHEVSNAEYRAFRAEHDSGGFGGLSLNADEQPAVRLSWGEVVAFLNWLSIKDGLQPVYEQRESEWFTVRPLRNGYRLPTEAEWAWAARFAQQPEPLVFPWGEALPPPDRSGNYADLAAAKILATTLVTYNDGFPVSAPSGSFAPNVIGIADLGGNVAEWVQDFYALETTSPTEALVDPLGPEEGRFHVVRGSSWRSATLTTLRLAYRDYSDDGREDIGFRLARNLE
jgi:formylglycine-generating enzyme required for sulfatase activity